MMKDKKLSGTQLYYNIGPLSALLMLTGGYFVDLAGNKNVPFWEFQFTQEQLVSGPRKRKKKRTN